MVKDGEDFHGLQTTKLKLFKPFNRDVDSLSYNFSNSTNELTYPL